MQTTCTCITFSYHSYPKKFDRITVNYLANEAYKYKIAAKCSKNDARQKKESLHMDEKDQARSLYYLIK